MSLPPATRLRRTGSAALIAVAGVIAWSASPPLLSSSQSTQFPPTGSRTPFPFPIQQPAPVFRARVDLIQVDVSVLDRDRRPVRGLTGKDFTLLEDGKPQSITAMVEMSASDPEAPADSWMRTVVPDVKVNNAEDGRVLLIILDDAGTSPEPLRNLDGRAIGPDPKTAAKQVARAIVERLGPADLAAVIFTVKNKHEQEFTSDRNRLFAAIEGFSPLVLNGFNILRALDTYKDAAKFLASIPQRRKAIILISPFMPSVLPIDVSAAGVNPIEVDSKPDGMRQEVLEEALRGNVTFYNINPMMMNGLENEIDQLLDPDSATPTGSASFGRPTSGPPPTPKYYSDVRRAPLDQLTGGFSIRRTADFAAGITQIFRETGSYYLLGYTNPTAKDDGKLRKIEVRVNRPDLTVRARTGYFAPKKNDATKYVSPMWNAIAGLLPAKDIAMRISGATFAIPGKKEAALAIVLGLRQPIGPEATGPVPEVVDVLAQAFTTNGDRRGQPQVIRAELLLHPNPRGESKYEVLSLLKLKPGRYHIRVSATSHAQGKSGSIYYDLEVPDYAKAPLSLSGVLLSATPALVAGPKDVFAPILPVIPTSQREFRGHRGQAYMRVYQGGKAAMAPVEMAVRITDTADVVVIAKTDSLPADRFDTHRAAEYRFDLPIATLAPGSYLLTFEARMAGAPTVRQDVRFVVGEPLVAR